MSGHAANFDSFQSAGVRMHMIHKDRQEGPENEVR